MNSGRLIMLRQRLDKLSENGITAIKAERLLRRFNKGTHNPVKLRKALAVTVHRHFSEITLLTHDAHKLNAAIFSSEIVIK